MAEKRLPTMAEIIALARKDAEAARGGRVAKPSAKYLARARALAEAIDVAAAVRRRLRLRADENTTVFEAETRRMALEPEPGFDKIASLKYLEASFFTAYNEGSGREVDAFWREVATRGLPFERRDPARRALERGRITSAVDYETVSDAVSDERFTAAERRKLDAMLEAYGARAVKRTRRR